MDEYERLLLFLGMKKKKKIKCQRRKSAKFDRFSKLEEFEPVYGTVRNWILAESSYRTIQNTKENFQFRGKETENGNASVSGVGLATMPFIT